MFSKIKFIFLTFLIFFALPTKIDAAFSYTIDSISSSIITSKDQVISVTLTVLDLPSGDSYFRVGINEGSSYVGYNKVGTDWIKLIPLNEDETNKTCSKYLKVSTDGTYVIDFKVGNDIDISNGDHILKAHRFRSSCTVDTLKPEIAVVVSLPTPSPSLVPTNQPITKPTSAPTTIPTKTSSPTPVAILKPSSTSTPTKIGTPKPTPIPTQTESMDETDRLPIPINLEDNTITTGEVLGDEITKKSPIIAILFIASGLAFLGYGGFLLYNKNNQNKVGQEKKNY